MLRPYTLRGRSLQRRHVDPPTVGPGLERQLCELHALRALAEIVREWRVRRDVTVRVCVLQLRRPATALPSVPSTWICSKSSRYTRTAHEELNCATISPA